MYTFLEFIQAIFFSLASIVMVLAMMFLVMVMYQLQQVAGFFKDMTRQAQALVEKLQNMPLLAWALKHARNRKSKK